MGGRGIQMWERVIGGWVGDTCVRACDWWVDGDTCVRACDWWVDRGYKCGSLCLVGGRGIHV